MRSVGFSSPHINTRNEHNEFMSNFSNETCRSGVNVSSSHVVAAAALRSLEETVKDNFNVVLMFSRLTEMSRDTFFFLLRATAKRFRRRQK